jgi:Protein of unknown function (DUF4058)
MPSPFPGMNPYLEHPDRWSTVHNRLIVALADVLTPQLLPKYQVDIEKRIYETNMPILEEVREAYLEVKEVATQRVITAIEIVSPTNKRGDGRSKYEQKRQQVLSSQTHWVEIDLLRDGKPMPIVEELPKSDYRILVSRSNLRPAADLYSFTLLDVIPQFALPLQGGDRQPIVDLGTLLNEIYDRSGYDRLAGASADAVRAKLADLELNDQDIVEAVYWARQ